MLPAAHWVSAVYATQHYDIFDCKPTRYVQAAISTICPLWQVHTQLWIKQLQANNRISVNGVAFAAYEAFVVKDRNDQMQSAGEIQADGALQ